MSRIIDPNFFDQAINEFKFTYIWYVETGIRIDDLGRRIPSFDKRTIEMSLQPDQSRLVQTSQGNHHELTYKWYCKAIYRVNIGDFFFVLSGNYLHVDSVQSYDGWGVRQGSCTMVNLSQYKNLEDYIKYINGEKIL